MKVLKCTVISAVLIRASTALAGQSTMMISIETFRIALKRTQGAIVNLKIFLLSSFLGISCFAQATLKIPPLDIPVDNLTSFHNGQIGVKVTGDTLWLTFGDGNHVCTSKQSDFLKLDSKNHFVSPEISVPICNKSPSNGSQSSIEFHKTPAANNDFSSNSATL